MSDREGVLTAARWLEGRPFLKIETYESKLPVLYVNTENGQAIASKEDYINGSLKIQGNALYAVCPCRSGFEWKVYGNLPVLRTGENFQRKGEHP